MSDFDDMRLREILERYRVDGDDLDVRHGIPALTPAYLAHRSRPQVLSPREVALLEAKTLGDAIRATELSNDPEPAAGPPDTIVSLGDGKYKIGGTEFSVTDNEDCVLQAFLDAKGNVLMDPQLNKDTGVCRPDRVLRAICKKYDGAAAAVTFPKRRRCGYLVRIVAAPKS
jgi:hypothetical protein